MGVSGWRNQIHAVQWGGEKYKHFFKKHWLKGYKANDWKCGKNESCRI